MWDCASAPAFDESAFDEGLGFDGSSIRGWQGISESDMLLMPDAASAILDPFTEAPTLSLLCEIADPTTGERYGRDPRVVARRAEAYLTETGIADTAYMARSVSSSSSTRSPPSIPAISIAAKARYAEFTLYFDA